MKLKSAVLVVPAAILCQAASGATIIDDFTSGSLAAYTQYTVNDGGTARGTTFTTPLSGTISANSTNTAHEQVLFLRSGTTLAVGETISLTGTFSSSLATTDDFGLAIGPASVTGLASGSSGDVRGSQPFVEVSYRNNLTRINSLGVTPPSTFNSQATAGGAVTTSTLLGLFITRASATNYTVGYTTASGSTNLFTYSYAAATDLGATVGFWTDLRGAGTASISNAVISVVPEPSAALLGSLGVLGLMRRRRA